MSRQTFYSAVTLLWRLEVSGHGGDALRPDWEAMRAAALDIAEDSNLHDLACAMTFIASGDEANLARLLERVAAAPDNSIGAEIVRPLIQGLHAYRRGDFAGAIDLIAPIALSLGRLSEFTDQISVFQETLADARARQGRGASRPVP